MFFYLRDGIRITLSGPILSMRVMNGWIGILMHDTHDDRLSPMRPLLCQGKIKVVDSGFEAITGTYPRGQVRRAYPEPFQGKRSPDYLYEYLPNNPSFRGGRPYQHAGHY